MAYNTEKLREERLKLLKKLDKDFVREMQTYADRTEVKQLEFVLKNLAKQAQAIASQKASDEELNELLDKKKELEAPYREQLGQNKAKARLVGILLQEVGDFE